MVKMKKKSFVTCYGNGYQTASFQRRCPFAPDGMVARKSNSLKEPTITKTRNHTQTNELFHLNNNASVLFQIKKVLTISATVVQDYS